MKQVKNSILNSIILVSSLFMGVAARAERIGPCVNQTRSASIDDNLRAFDYRKVNGFLEYKSLREGWTQRYIPSSVEDSAYVESLDEGVLYTCRIAEASGIRCVASTESCHFYKNDPEILASVDGPLQDAGVYWIKEDEHTSCIINKRLDGAIVTRVADCMTPRQDLFDGIRFSFFDEENRVHPSLGKVWYNCAYGICQPDYSKIYLQLSPDR